MQTLQEKGELGHPIAERAPALKISLHLELQLQLTVDREASMKAIALKPTHHKLAKAASIAVLALAANQAQAVDYSFSDLGTITGPYAGTGAVANAINNLGQVAGNNSLNALVWNGDTATQLDSLPGQVAAYQGMAINDAGQIAGYNRNLTGI